MGLFGKIGDMGKAAAGLAHLQREASHLVKASSAARAERGLTVARAADGSLAAPRGLGKVPTMVDFPGVEVGTKFDVVKGSRLLGIDSIRGSAVTREIGPHGSRFDVKLSLGPMRKHLDLDLQQVGKRDAEVLLRGLGVDHPILASVAQARRGHLKLVPADSRSSIEVAQKGGNAYDISFNIGSSHNTLRLTKQS